MTKLRNTAALTGLATLMLAAAPQANADDLSANVGISNNYIWRGLTQTENGTAVSGGIDYAADSGFYAGTWVSNVSYAPGDVFSYEHDIYFGYSGEFGDGIGYDFGYLYYNYDKEAEFDFGEIYGSLSIDAFTFGLNIVTNTEADEGPGQDFGFGETFYAYADYSVTVREDVELGFHVGYHDGDFSEAFNGVPEGYLDYALSLSKDGFTFAITGTDLDDPGPDNLDNDEIKFVVSYAVDFAL
ncbi:MAG: TorF family putative porin [Pseudomonadota bacterium]